MAEFTGESHISMWCWCSHAPFSIAYFMWLPAHLTCTYRFEHSIPSHTTSRPPSVSAVWEGYNLFGLYTSVWKAPHNFGTGNNFTVCDSYILLPNTGHQWDGGSTRILKTMKGKLGNGDKPKTLAGFFHHSSCSTGSACVSILKIKQWLWSLLGGSCFRKINCS